jgi:hypothetical protein
MLTASFIAIFLVPALFYLVERFSGGMKTHPEGQPAPVGLEPAEATAPAPH